MIKPSAKSGALVLLGAGGAVALAASASVWAGVSAEDGLVGVSVEVTGGALAPLSSATGVVGLAAIPAVLAVRRVLRVVVAVLVLGLGLVALAQTVAVAVDLADAARAWWRVDVGALAGSAEVSATAWPYAAILGLTSVVAGSAVVLARGSGWGGLSSRYDAPRPGDAARARAVEADTWQALDRGEDPTDDDGPRS